MSRERDFLTRWMRRKETLRRQASQRTAAQSEAPAPAAASPSPVTSATAAAPVSAVPPQSTAAPAAAPQPRGTSVELPPLESLQGLLSDYRAFMEAGVDKQVQRTALKALFSDPHFNQMDGLDVYIDDYGIPDPIPPSMLAALKRADPLLFGETPAEEVDVEAVASAGSELEEMDEAREAPAAVAAIAAPDSVSEGGSENSLPESEGRHEA